MLLWGDSKAEPLYYGMLLASAPGRRWSLVGRWGCPPFFIAGFSTGPGATFCASLDESIDRALEQDHSFDTVVLTFAAKNFPNAAFVRSGADSDAAPSSTGWTRLSTGCCTTPRKSCWSWTTRYCPIHASAWIGLRWVWSAVRAILAVDPTVSPRGRLRWSQRRGNPTPVRRGSDVGSRTTLRRSAPIG